MTEKIKFINYDAIAIYRLSSGRQADGLSLSVQSDEIHKYCKSVGLRLVKEFSIIESAKDSSKRVKYNDAIKYAEKNKIGNIVFYMSDRESRNLTDLETNEQKVKQGIFMLHFAKDNYIFHKDSPDSEFLTRGFNGLINRQYVRNLSTKVNDGMRKKAESGWYPGNMPPLGYICQKAVDPETGRIKNRGGIIIIDPNVKNRKIVEREFELRSKGYSFSKIRETVIDEGLIDIKKIKNYGESAIEYRLKNPFYSGSFIWQDILYKGNHELFISKQLFRKVEETFGLRAGAVRRKEDEYTSIVGGWLKCSCGSHIVYDPKKKTNKKTNAVTTYHYYHCTNGKRAHISLVGLNISSDKIWEQFEDVIGDIGITSEFADEIALALNQIESKAHLTTKMQIELLKREESEFQNKEDSLLDFLLEGKIDQFMFDKKLKSIRSDRALKYVELEMLQLSLSSAVLESANSILELAKNAKSLWKSQTISERKELLNMVLSNPVLNGVNVEFNLKKPFDVLVEMKGNDKWRTRQDSNLRPTD